MGWRLGAGRIGHHDGNQALAFGVREHVFEDGLHLFDILRKPGGNSECCQTALHGAALFGYDDVIKHLVAHNANTSRPNQ
jgi:hypothetical protein